MSDLRPPEIVLVRHGETDWSRDGRHTGRTDVSLNDEGRAGAEALGEELRQWRFVRVLTSPLARATETARLAGLGDVAEPRDDLLEWDYGAYEGKKTVEIREERPGWTLWRDGVPGGETADEVCERVDRVIRRARSVDGDVLLFGHAHCLRALAARWVGRPVTDGRLYRLDTGSLSVLGYERETPVIVHWNATGSTPLTD